VVLHRFAPAGRKKQKKFPGLLTYVNTINDIQYKYNEQNTCLSLYTLHVHKDYSEEYKPLIRAGFDF